MINYREILRLDSLGHSQRIIASGAKASRNTVSEVMKKAEQLNISCPLEDDMPNEMLDELFYGKRDSHPTPFAVINYEYIHRELSKKDVTLTLLWQEYSKRAYANGETPYMSTQFGDKYRRWARVTKAIMLITHKPGDTMQVDGMSKLIRPEAPFSTMTALPVRSTRHICLSRLCLAAVDLFMSCLLGQKP